MAMHMLLLALELLVVRRDRWKCFQAKTCSQEWRQVFGEMMRSMAMGPV